MPYTSVVVRVLIASPGDVAAERDAVQDVIANWNATHSHALGITLLPVRWETHATPELGDRPQAIINRQLVDDADVLVGVFWTRLGTDTGVAQSGTAEEIERFRHGGKPALLYFSTAQVNPEKLDLAQHERLRNYKKELQGQGLLETYATLPEFREKLLRHLTIVARRFSRTESPAAGPVAASSESTADLNDEHVKILRALSELDGDDSEPASADDIASELKITASRTKHLLDGLLDGKYIDSSRAVGRPPLYSLASRGRSELVVRGLL